jgi:hypothetical protein
MTDEAETAHLGRPIGSRFVTEEAVYSLILVAGMIVVTGTHGESSWSVFVTVVATVLVFWAAHVYAGTLAHLGTADRALAHFRNAFGASVRRSSGLLIGAAVPAIVLLLGASRVIDDENAMWVALWIDLAALAVLGYIAFARRSASMVVRLVGAAITAAFGAIMILLKAFIH